MRRRPPVTTPTCGTQLTIPALLMAGLVRLVYDYQLTEWNRDVCVSRRGQVYFGRRDLAERIRLSGRRLAGRGGRRGRFRTAAVADVAGGGGGGGVTVTSIFPASGDSIGGKTLDITGTGFESGMNVTVGGNAATSVVVNSSTSITCSTPAGTAGLVGVSVDGVTLSNVYIYRGGTYNRPSVTRNSAVDVYVDAAAGGGGDGSIGTPYTLAEAKSNLANGQRLYLKGDFGSGSFINFTGLGTATDGIIVTRWPGEASQPVLQGDTSGNQYPACFINTGDYIVIEDIEINVTGSSGQAVDGRGGTFCQVVNCTVTGGNIKLGASTSAGTSNWFISGNTISSVGSLPGNTGDGIWLQNQANNNVIVQNTITTSGHSCITISHNSTGESTGSECEDNVMAYNTCTNTWAGGIILNGNSTRTICECNDISDSGTHVSSVAGTRSGIQLQGDDNIVRYNRIWGCEHQGISLQAYTLYFMQSCTGNLVHNNTIFGCGGPPLHMVCHHNDPDTHLINNTIESNLGWANHTAGAVEAGGYFSGNYYMIWAYTDHSGLIWNSGTIGGNIYRNNHFARTTSAEQWFINVRLSGDGGNITQNLATFESTFANCENNSEGADPGFTDENNDDFTLDADGSVAVDAGYATAGVTYLGSAPDMGVYERV